MNQSELVNLRISEVTSTTCINMKIFDRGYWVGQHFYWQSMYHYLYNCASSRSMTYFSAANTAIELGGMLHDRKTDIYALLPKGIVPHTSIITSITAADAFIRTNDLQYPLIIKPNVGMAGFKVDVIRSHQELTLFFETEDVSEREWLLQEYLDYDREFSVLIYKYPVSGEFGISSLVEKTYPSVTADGLSTVEALILGSNNPFIDKNAVLERLKDRLQQIPAEGEKIVLDVIGNYKRGSKFFDRNNAISPQMTTYLQDLFSSVEGLGFFRVDFKADSLESFLDGQWKVIEINGAKSEPLHIYDPRNSFLENVRILREHWRIMAEISQEQRSQRFEVPSFKNGLKSWMAIRRLVK